MATIDYKQKIKDYMNSSEVDTLYKSMLNNLFPELAESEDERIRHLLISFVKYDMPDNYSDDFSKEDCLAWLEKQSEKGTNGNEREIPNSSWSGEDEDNMMMIEDRLSDYLDYIREDTSLTKHQKNSMKEEVIGYDNWFKSLRERYICKPSDEQMAVLNEVINYAANSELQHWNNFIYTLLKSLREQLKKLREE